MKDALNHLLSGCTAQSLDHFEQALESTLCFAGDPLACVDAALAAAPGFVMAHALRGYLYVLSSEARAVPPAQQALHAALALPHDDREAAHLRALQQLCAGRWRAAARTLEDLSLARPRDALALAMGHQLDFFTGDTRLLRDRMARALPDWSPAMPGWHGVLAMMAFGLEENGDYAGAERLGRRAIELQPSNAWAQHAVVHVMEMQGRREEGVHWMQSQRGWQQPGGLARHNAWHLALHHLALGDTDRVLALYDGPIHGQGPQLQLEWLDASALLWRLRLQDVDVGDRWHTLAALWAAAADEGHYAFNDWHAAMAFVAAGRDDLLLRLAQAQAQAVVRGGDNADFTREVGLAVTQGFIAYGRQQWTRCTDLLRAARSQAHRFGGSHAQRDLIDLTLLDAARRGGDAALAVGLERERSALAQQRRQGVSSRT